jgi:hypothetical protein
MEITNKQQAAAGYTEVDPQAYEAVLNGKPVHLYTLTNKQGLIVKIQLWRPSGAGAGAGQERSARRCDPGL